jgi:hypothetical protein
MRNRTAGCVLLLAVWAAPVGAQDLGTEVAALRREVEQLRDELARLKATLATPSPADVLPASTPAPSAPSQTRPIEPAVEMLKAQVAEHAQTKVESASRFPVRLSGSIVSSTFYNSGTPNWLDLPNVVMPSGPDGGSFSSTLRQSRLGLEASGLQIGSWQGSGTLLFDFFGGIPGFPTGQVMGLPRLLYAFARFEGPRGGVLVGQDEAILAPRNPTSLAALSFPALFRSGNLYLRVPQIRGEARLPLSTTGSLRVIGGLTAPIAGDYGSTAYVFVPPELGGERSERPGVQARVVWDAARRERHAISLGVSGHASAQQTGGATRESWVAAADGDVQWGRFGAAGEVFVADRAAAFGASLGQQARTRGGWLELRFAPARWQIVAGGGTDRLVRASAVQQPLRSNTTGFAGLHYRFSPEVALGVEYFRLQTAPAAGVTRKNDQVHWTLRYDF